MRSRPPVIGIYLGTEYSCVGVCRNGRVHIIENDIGKMRTPSCVAFTPDKRLIGEAAEIQADKNPTNTIFDINRMIGKPFSDPTVQSDRKQWPFNVIEGAGDKPNIVVQYRGDKKQFLPEQLSAMILKKMKEIAENYLKCIVQDAVVTVPAYFSDSQKLATKDACEIAGLKVLNIMDEPIAAATFYRFQKFSSKENVLVFSLGGSNLDVSVLNFKKGVFEVMATAGDMHLGSMDFDNRLLDYFLLEIERRYEKDIRDNPMSIGKLRCACERVKRSIYEGARTFATVEVHGLYEGIDFNTRITQARFEEINMDLFKRCMGFVTKCLENARMDKTAIDQVMLVGDDTQIPMVQQMLRELFDGKEFCISTNPSEVVAYGAAIKANRLWMWHATPKAEARPAHQLELLEAHKLIEQLIYEGDDAKKHSEELISEIHDARRLSEAAQKRVEQLISETDDARKLSEAAQKRTEQLMSERDDVRKLLEATQKLTEQLLYERDEARKFSEAAQKLTEQLVSERDDTRELLGKAQTQINQLISERDEAGKKIEELRWLTEQQAHHSQCVGCFIGYSYSKLQNATNNFQETFKLGEGGFGKVYKGNLHNTTIAIKIPNELSNEGAKQFHQEVEVLSKLQHPHLVKLLGACAENHALIYEYMPNGSLQDRLDCKNNTPPLSWQARVRIAFEICSALSFLHSSKPHGIAHGDLKPDNVLLDSNNVSKISDFGLCRQLNWTTSTSRPFHKTNTIKGTFGYIDPEFMTTLKMTPQNDVYSFGIMLLQLVTCKNPANIRESVDEAHRKGTLKALIDASAGPWPFKQVQKMISLGLRCSDPVRINRPDMSTVVLKEMKSIASAAQSSRVASIFCR